MKFIKTVNNQSIWDIANQEYGSESGVLQLMIDNPSVVNFNDSIPGGTTLRIDESKIINKTVVEYLSTRGMKPTTAIQ